MSNFESNTVLGNNPINISDLDLYDSRADLDQIRKVYIKKAPYVKNEKHETKSVEVGSAKRNIQRSGGNINHKTGKHFEGGKKKMSKDMLDDGSTYEYQSDVRNLDEHDPNYDSEVFK